MEALTQARQTVWTAALEPVLEHLAWIVSALAVVFFAWRWYKEAAMTKALRHAGSVPREYDVIIIGGSIAGPPLAIQLARQGRKVLVIESSLERPDRIVGELLQPGGLAALRKIGLEHCARDAGVPCSGYVSQFDGQWVQLPYEDGIDGVSFHFGDFVMNLRREMLRWNETTEAKRSGGSLTVIEGTATELIFDPSQQIVLGAKYKLTSDKSNHQATAHLVALCDGGFSKFRPTKKRQPVHSYFVGIILKNITMPHETRGHVMLCRDGPVLSYRLDNNEVRVLADYRSTSPKNPTNDVLIKWLSGDILPQMPKEFQQPLIDAIAHAKQAPNALRTHPHFHFTPIFPRYRGIVTVGDSGNQRHPLTGGGMTCAINDTIKLATGLSQVPYLGHQEKVHSVVMSYLRTRPLHTSVINVLSWALHGVFRGPFAMQKACFDYFKLGGDCVRVPMAFLSGINGSLWLLMYHYVRVMIYGAFLVLTNGKHGIGALLVGLCNPLRWLVGLHLVFHATVIFVPVLAVEFLALGRICDTTLYHL